MGLKRPDVPAGYIPKVEYGGKQISDGDLRTKLQQIAVVSGFDVIVKSGERKHTPKGGAKGSLHKKN